MALMLHSLRHDIHVASVLACVAQPSLQSVCLVMLWQDRAYLEDLLELQGSKILPKHLQAPLSVVWPLGGLLDDLVIVPAPLLQQLA